MSNAPAMPRPAPLLPVRTRRLVLVAAVPEAVLEIDGTRLVPAAIPGWVMFDLVRDGERIGEAGLSFESERAADVGYRIAKAWRRQGLAVEAVGALIRLAFGPFGLDNLGAETAEDNAASLATLARHGFAPTGRTAERWSTRRQRYVTYRHFVLERRGGQPPIAR